MGNWKFKETENLSKTIFHWRWWRASKLISQAPKPCSCHEGHQVLNVHRIKAPSPLVGFQVRLLESCPQGWWQKALSEASTEPRVYSSGCHGFRSSREINGAAIGFYPVVAILIHTGVKDALATDLVGYMGSVSLVLRRAVPSTVRNACLSPGCLFLASQGGLGVMKQMSEPTMRALEAEIGISQDRY